MGYILWDTEPSKAWTTCCRTLNLVWLVSLRQLTSEDLGTSTSDRIAYASPLRLTSRHLVEGHADSCRASGERKERCK